MKDDQVLLSIVSTSINMTEEEGNKNGWVTVNPDSPDLFIKEIGGDTPRMDLLLEF